MRLYRRKEDRVFLMRRLVPTLPILLAFLLTGCGGYVPKKEIVWEETDLAKTPTLQDYPDADAVILQDSGEYIIDRHCVYNRCVKLKILKKAGLDYANIEIPFVSDEEVYNISGRTIKKDGTVVYLLPEDIHEKTRFPKYILYADSKVKVFAMPGVEVGSVIEYSYSIKNKIPFVWRFQREVPILYSKLLIEAPDAFKYDYTIANPYNLKVEKSISHHKEKVRLEFVIHDLPAITYEPFMPPISDVITQIYLPLTEIADDGYNIPIVGTSWRMLGDMLWYDILKERLKSDQFLEHQALEIVGGSTDDLEKIAKIYEYLRSNVRYVAVEIGEGRFIPHNPAEVLKKKYGDCKDKAILFIALLKAIGIEAYPVLTLTRGSGTVIEHLISGGQFNHMVIAIPGRHFSEIENYNKFVVRVKGLFDGDKEYIVLDPTSSAVPFPQLPWYLEDTKALLIKEDESTLISIASSLAEDNETIYTTDVSIQDNESVICSTTVIRKGQEANKLRDMLLYLSDADQKEFLEHTLAVACPGATIEDISISQLTDIEKPLLIHYHYTIPHYVHSVESFRAFSPCILHLSMVDELTRKEREHPLWFDFCATHTDVINIRIPAGYSVKSIPEMVSTSSAFAHFSCSCKEEDRLLVLERRLTIHETEIPTYQYNEVGQLFETISTSERKNVILNLQ